MRCNHKDGGALCTQLLSPEDICGITTAEWPLLERKCHCFQSDPSISGPFKHTLDVCVYSKTQVSKSQASNVNTLTSPLDASAIYVCVCVCVIHFSYSLR